jgi:hypothetical protein
MSFIFLAYTPCFSCRSKLLGSRIQLYEFHDEKLDISPAVEYVKDVVQYWVGEFHLDGIRFDAGLFCLLDLISDLTNKRILRENRKLCLSFK